MSSGVLVCDTCKLPPSDDDLAMVSAYATCRACFDKLSAGLIARCQEARRHCREVTGRPSAPTKMMN